MTVVELFAGAGGASLGLLAAGFEEVRAVEWNADACATRRLAGLRCDEGDVRDPAHYEGVTADSVWSSFPCQAWSTAGKRIGKDDPRNGWPWTVGVLDQVRPMWFMGENVPGLTYHSGGCAKSCAETCAHLYFEGTILRELRDRFAWVGWSILDAARFGVPQTRERLFIVAGPRPIVWPAETHAPPGELKQVGLFAERRLPWVTVREALGLAGNVQAGIASLDCGERGVPRSTDAPSPAVSSASRTYYHPVLDAPAPCITGGSDASHANGRSALSGNRATRERMTGAGIRSYTVRETATIQGYPPTFQFFGSAQSQYRQIGNSCAWPVVEALARAVRNA